MGHRLLERYLQVVRMDGLQTNKNIVVGGSANLDMSGSSGQLKAPTGGLVTSGGGVAQTGTNQSTVFHSGGVAPLGALTTNYHQTQFSTTTSYVAEVFIPANSTLTGVSIVNGATTSASQNIFVGLADSTGTVVAKSATTTAQGAASSYQQIPFTATYAAKGPGKYFILVQGSATTGYLGTHAAGNFSATSVTSETYGTFLTTAAYATTTFTANVGPVADVY